MKAYLRVVILLFPLFMSCSTCDGEGASKIGDECGDEDYWDYCEDAHTIVECAKCDSLFKKFCWKQVGCSRGRECRYSVYKLNDEMLESAVCLLPSDPSYPNSTSTPQTYQLEP